MILSRSIAALLVLLLAGCTSSRSFTMPNSTPGDFVLALTVFEGTDSTEHSRVSVPARYIVEPNAVLRASIGPGSAPTTYPRPARFLTADEIDQIWELTKSINLTGTESGIQVVDSPEIYTSPAGQSVYLLEIRSDHAQRAFEVSSDNQNAQALVEQLADLAWVQSD